MLKNLQISKKSCTFASQNAKHTRKNMEAALRQPVMQHTGTISEEKWNSLHTIDELDASLKHIIHNHFHG